MDSSNDRRNALCDRICAIVLADGLGAFALRGLAARLGTSGRMLLYYFGSKDVLIRETLHRINAGLQARLSGLDAMPPVTPGSLVAFLLEQSNKPDMAPVMRLWTEVVSAGARGETPYDQLAPSVVENWIGWLESRLVPACRGNGMAETILALMDGVILLETARPGTTSPARALLPGLLDGMARDSHAGDRTNPERRGET
ncbi:TetR/AcrR family transcriptional regulator [Acetobacteraceae bacterium KSS8]|uniref:TetR/AcrR family transcriptional regulator n=1 Tax=Endosaccharibacter trunci TaxID=2812733 RepID=A0ABT1W5U9_9PROT|nr:TetR/AcrR family transcriptional regulator [Acetobacteraceae bacterium KSS8]